MTTYHILIEHKPPAGATTYAVACAPNINWRAARSMNFCVPSLTGYRLPFLDKKVEDEDVCRECRAATEAMKHRLLSQVHPIEETSAP